MKITVEVRLTFMKILFPEIREGNNFPLPICLKLRPFLSEAGASEEEKDKNSKKIACFH